MLQNFNVIRVAIDINRNGNPVVCAVHRVQKRR